MYDGNTIRDIEQVVEQVASPRSEEGSVAASFTAPLTPKKFHRLSDKEISDGVMQGLQRSSGCFE